MNPFVTAEGSKAVVVDSGATAFMRMPNADGKYVRRQRRRPRRPCLDT